MSSKSPGLCIICVIEYFVNSFMLNEILQRRTFDELGVFSGVIKYFFIRSLECILFLLMHSVEAFL